MFPHRQLRHDYVWPHNRNPPRTKHSRSYVEDNVSCIIDTRPILFDRRLGWNLHSKYPGILFLLIQDANTLILTCIPALPLPLQTTVTPLGIIRRYRRAHNRQASKKRPDL